MREVSSKGMGLNLILKMATVTTCLKHQRRCQLQSLLAKKNLLFVKKDDKKKDLILTIKRCKRFDLQN